MKLLRYGEKGVEKPGIMDDEGHIRCLAGIIDDIDATTISEQSLKKLKDIDLQSLPIVDANTRIGACVNGVGKFLCIGLNYSDHAAESGMEVPSEPVLFMKATSAISGPNDPVLLPRRSEKSDWEVELGVVIGKEAKYISEEQAMDYVAGFCLINDLSERQFQLEMQGTWDKGKGCDTFGPIGPWLVTKEEVGDFDDLSMWLTVNGKIYQNGNTNTMVYKVPFIVAYLSQFMSLQPGDVISTGTPPGVGLGQNPPVYLKRGDEIVLGIDKLGRQYQRVITEADLNEKKVTDIGIKKEKK
jgi:2,4-didehydro-3-deoxy-L-rhamnonate hydrolase